MAQLRRDDAGNTGTTFYQVNFEPHDWYKWFEIKESSVTDVSGTNGEVSGNDGEVSGNDGDVSGTDVDDSGTNADEGWTQVAFIV